MYDRHCKAKQAEYYQDMQKANEQYKRNPETFFDDIGVDKKHFFDGLKEYQVLLI